MILRVGAPMWAHPPWRVRLGFTRGRELADYATWCNSVEGNTTFYAVPSEATVERWSEQAPADFRFVFKAPRAVTHDHRLGHGAHGELASFLRAVRPLSDRMGPILLQLPPSFDRLDVLAEFVIGLPTSFRWSVELRHRTFFDGDGRRRVDEVLRTAGVGRTVLDTRPLYQRPVTTAAGVEERRTKPDLPVTLDHVGDEPIVRVIHGDHPDSDGLSRWVPTVARWLEHGLRPYVFVHRPDNESSPEDARRFHAMVSASVAAVTPLPEPSGLDPGLF